MNSIHKNILVRMRKLGAGKIHASKDFLDLGSRAAVDQALSRLAEHKTIRRLGGGLYYIPRINPTLGIELAPDMDAVAHAIARKTGSRIVPSGAVAANWLGLSTQVPAKPVYLTDGKSRSIRAGNTVFTMKHVSPRDLPLGSPTSAMVFQALRHIGEESINEGIITHLRKRLTAKDQRKLLKDLLYVTGWISGAARKVCKSAGASGEARHG